MSRVLIIGGGAAGMMAAVTAADNGHKVTVFEKNEKTGKKLYITGKGRCNVTNAGDEEDLFRNVISNPRFLYSAFSNFNSADAMDFFKRIGLELKVERGNRVFPVSDHSSDVIRCLTDEMKRLKVEVRLNSQVTEIIERDGVFSHLVLKGGEKVAGDACIIATGGLSYPTTGSTGDGYRFAKELGHSVTELYPSLVGVGLKEEFIPLLEGLSLKNVELHLREDPDKKKKDIFTDFGEMLFTRNGISGPIVLSASSYIGPLLKKKPLVIVLDLKPALSKEQLDARILRDFDEYKNRQYKNALEHLLPQRLIGVIIKLSGIDPEKKVNLITREERRNLVEQLKGLTLHVDHLLDYKEAVITKGGVRVKEIDPQTMESKIVKRVYFAGEVIDLDALTGGYNLQIAWSTARAAGKAVES